jgi:hypothetical protein
MNDIFKFLPPPLGDIINLTGLGFTPLVGTLLTMCFIPKVFGASYFELAGFAYMLITFLSSRAVVGDFSSYITLCF